MALKRTSVSLDPEILRAIDEEIKTIDRFNVSRNFLINEKLRNDKNLQRFIRPNKLIRQ